MAKSAAYARIKRDVLSLVSAIPAGQVALFTDVAAALEVMPRHVAYILAMLSPEEAEATPWYRAVPKDGRVKETQAVFLRREGVAVESSGQIEDLELVRWTPG